MGFGRWENPKMERSSVMWGKVSLRNASHSNLFCEQQKGFLCVQAVTSTASQKITALGRFSQLNSVRYKQMTR